jgi:hypothetical protein
VALVPLAVFGAVSARAGDEDHGARNGGIGLALGGLTLAPLVAHAVNGTTDRGLGLSLPPLLGTGAIASLLLVSPETLRTATAVEQLVFSTAFSFTVVSSLLGVIDVTQGKKRFAVVPLIGQVGVMGVFQ